MCSANPPPPPDSVGAANAQGAANVETARIQGRLSNPSVYGPYGSQVVTWDGDTPIVRQTLSPEEQHLQNQQWHTRAQLGDLGIQGVNSLFGVVGQELDLSGAPQGPSAYSPDGRLQVGEAPGVLDSNSLPGVGSSEEVRNRVIEAMMGRADEALDQRQDQVNSELIARGLRPGTEAYAREMDTINRARNDARQQAEIAGGDAAAQAFGMDLSRRGQMTAEQGQRFGQELQGSAQQFSQRGQASELAQRQQGQMYGQQSDARQRAIQEILMRRQTPLNEISAIRSGTQVNNPFSMPGYAGAGNIAPPPIFGAAQQQAGYNTDVYNAEQSAANSNNSAMASAAMMAIMYY